MTTMAGTTSFAAFGGTTFYSTIMETEPLQMSRSRQDFTRIVYDGGSGCTWLDFDRDGFLDLFVCNFVELDLAKAPLPGHASYCQWKGVPVIGC